MSYYAIKHYVVYRNEVIFVDPKDWPDGKWRKLLPPKFMGFGFIRQDEIKYQNPIAPTMRFAVRRIRHVGFDPSVGKDLLMKYITVVERIDRRRRLHDAEHEMKEADAMLSGAIRSRRKFKEDMANGKYAVGQIGTDAALRDDRVTRHALDLARDRAILAARRLYPMLVAFGTITYEEAARRIDVVAAFGGNAS